jgi:uncharacterized protein involved in oxidation of intracellular sulfur
MSGTLIVINSSPYGTENAYNALRLAIALLEGHPDVAVRLFLMSDGVLCAVQRQMMPEGVPNIGAMLADAIARGAEVKACVSCVKARGLTFAPLVDGVEVQAITDLAAWVMDSDRTIVL